MPRTAVLAKFDALHTSCRKGVRRTTKDKERDLTSLTSKALWCCYPNAVPIYDAFAQNALYVLSRLAGITPEASGHRYTRFSDVWFTIYSHVKPVIDQADLRGYSYKVRVFDRMLWILRTPNYSR